MKLGNILFVGLIASIIGMSPCYARNADEARVILLQSQINYNLKTFLEKIAIKDDFVTSLFIDSGFDVNSVSSLHDTPLKIAVLYDNRNAVDALISTGKVDLNWKDDQGRTALYIANILGFKDIADDLKASGAVETTTNSTVPLTDKGFATAKEKGTMLAANKTDFTFESSDTARAGGIRGRAYWITPFCNVINEQMTQSKYVKDDPGAIQFASRTYQARVMFSYLSNSQQLDNLKFVAIQNGKEINPIFVAPVKQQVTEENAVFGVQVWVRVGYIFNFYYSDITPGIPVEVKAISAATKTLTFKFDNSNEAEKSSTKEDIFKWTVL